MRKLKNFLVGCLLVLLVHLVDRHFTSEDRMQAPKESYLKWWGLGALLVLAVNALLIVLTSCATQPKKGYHVIGAQVVYHTILVENHSLDQLAIYVQGRRIGTVMLGRKECLELPATSDGFQVVGRPLGGGVNRYSPTLNAWQDWIWQVETQMGLDGYAGNLIPAEKPCK